VQIVKLWDFETGNSVFDFGEAHGDAAITCLDFDTTGRRCLTGGRDGAIKVWNYNNGHCLMTLRNREYFLSSAKMALKLAVASPVNISMECVVTSRCFVLF